MTRIVLIFGLIIGAILCANIVFTTNLMYANPDFKGNELVGYAAMVVVFSLTFFGMRNYRDKQLGGVISFGKAFKTGAFIAFTGATVYVVFWLFYYYLVVPDFLDVYIQHVLKSTEQSGATDVQLASKMKEMDDFKKMYANPAFNVLITYMEVLPVGLVVALFSALLVKRNPG